MEAIISMLEMIGIVVGVLILALAVLPFSLIFICALSTFYFVFYRSLATGYRKGLKKKTTQKRGVNSVFGHQPTDGLEKSPHQGPKGGSGVVRSATSIKDKLCQ